MPIQSFIQRFKCFIILLILGFLCLNCGNKSPILATVNGEKITINDFENQLDNILSADKQASLTPKQKEDLLEQLITDRLLIQEAKKKKIYRDCKKEIQKRLEWVKNQMLIKKLMEVEFSNNFSVSDSDVEIFYNSHKEELSKRFKGKDVKEIKEYVKRYMQYMVINDKRSYEAIEEWINGLKKKANITKNLTLLKN